MGITTLSQRIGNLKRGEYDGTCYIIVSERVPGKMYNQYRIGHHRRG